MTYYIARISDTQSEQEHITAVLLECDPHEIDERLNYICATWYSEDGPVAGDEEGYFYQTNGNVVYADEHKEITKETYLDLTHFLPDL